MTNLVNQLHRTSLNVYDDYSVFIKHPIYSLYTVESVKGTVPVIERNFGQKLRDSDKYFACFLVIRLHSVHYFSVDRLETCSSVILGQRTVKGVRGSTRKAFVLDDSCIKSLKSVFFLF